MTDALEGKAGHFDRSDLSPIMVRAECQSEACLDDLYIMADTSSDFDLEFPDNLRLALQTYICEGPPSVQLAAQIFGTSVRTLQRRLALLGLTYSDLVQQARFEAAAELLKNPDTKIIDVAFDVGYEDPSNFARAFRRVSGITPREFRRELAAL